MLRILQKKLYTIKDFTDMKKRVILISTMAVFLLLCCMGGGLNLVFNMAIILLFLSMFYNNESILKKLIGESLLRYLFLFRFSNILEMYKRLVNKKRVTINLEELLSTRIKIGAIYGKLSADSMARCFLGMISSEYSNLGIFPTCLMIDAIAKNVLGEDGSTKDYLAKILEPFTKYRHLSAKTGDNKVYRTSLYADEIGPNLITVRYGIFNRSLVSDTKDLVKLIREEDRGYFPIVFVEESSNKLLGYFTITVELDSALTEKHIKQLQSVDYEVVFKTDLDKPIQDYVLEKLHCQNNKIISKYSEWGDESINFMGKDDRSYAPYFGEKSDIYVKRLVDGWFRKRDDIYYGTTILDVFYILDLLREFKWIKAKFELYKDVILIDSMIMAIITIFLSTPYMIHETLRCYTPFKILGEMIYTLLTVWILLGCGKDKIIRKGKRPLIYIGYAIATILQLIWLRGSSVFVFINLSITVPWVLLRFRK